MVKISEVSTKTYENKTIELDPSKLDDVIRRLEILQPSLTLHKSKVEEGVTYVFHGNVFGGGELKMGTLYHKEDSLRFEELGISASLSDPYYDVLEHLREYELIKEKQS